MSFQRFNERRNDEEGMALLSVVILSTVIFITVMSLMSSTMMNITITADSRDSLKAMAAAEAGRDTVLEKLSKGECTSSGSVNASNLSPAYSYRVFNYTAVGNEVPKRTNQAGVLPGCPILTSTHVMIEVKGKARGITETIVSTYKWTSTASPVTTNTPKGALVTGSRLVMSNFKVLRQTATSSPADVIVQNGNFKCEGSGISISGGVYVQNGGVEDMQGCDGILNLSANGSVVVNKWSGVAVSGDVCARGAILNYWVLGTILGIVKQLQSSCPGIGNNTATWVDFNPSLTGAVRYTDTAICENYSNMGQPNVWRLEGHLAYRIKQFTTPTVIDLTGCPNGVRMNNVGGPNLPIKTDITIVAHKGALENFTITSADGLPHAFNVVSPDMVPGSPGQIPVPNCISGQGEMKILQLTTASKISGLIYTPCNTSQLVVNWTGQIFFGRIDSNVSNGQLVHSEMSLNGWGSSSSSTSTSTAKADLVLLSQIEL